jgi:hypothetical protein
MTPLRGKKRHPSSGVAGVGGLNLLPHNTSVLFGFICGAQHYWLDALFAVLQIAAGTKTVAEMLNIW